VTTKTAAPRRGSFHFWIKSTSGFNNIAMETAHEHQEQNVAQSIQHFAGEIHRGDREHGNEDGLERDIVELGSLKDLSNRTGTEVVLGPDPASLPSPRPFRPTPRITLARPCAGQRELTPRSRFGAARRSGAGRARSRLLRPWSATSRSRVERLNVATTALALGTWAKTNRPAQTRFDDARPPGVIGNKAKTAVAA